MKKISDISIVNELIKKHFVKNVCTNSFLSTDDFKREIVSDSLFFSETEGGLFLLRKREDFYILNFYIHGEVIFPEPEIPTVCEIPYKRKLSCEEFFKNSGFERFLERMRMTAAKPEKQAGSAYVAAEKDAGKAYELMCNSFNRYSGCIPSFEAFLKDIEEKRVIAFPGIKGILHFSHKGISSEIRHLCVDEKERGKGIADELVKTYHFLTDASKYQVWLSKDNAPAKRIYIKNGYTADGFESVVLTKGI